MTEQCRYFHLPLGNMASDATILGADIFYGRQLIKQNHVLWCSLSDRPDFGGIQECDSRYVYIYIYIYIYIYMCVCVCVCMYVYIYVCIYI